MTLFYSVIQAKITHSYRFWKMPMRSSLNLFLTGCFMLGMGLVFQVANAQTATLQHTLSLPNLSIDAHNLSGLALADEFIAIATDEVTEIELFTRKGLKFTRPGLKIRLSENNDELDIEGLAWQKPFLYAIGSHSAKRKKIKPSKSLSDNLKRLEKVIKEPARHQLFRIEMADTLQVKKIQVMSLTDTLKQHKILSPFLNIPSKENGIDIEGIAVNSKGILTLGFRGPVIRGNLAPLMTLELSRKKFKLKKATVNWLNLNGLGIRGLSNGVDEPDQSAKTRQPTLVLAGAVGDLETPYQVHWWKPNGKGANQNASQFKPNPPLCTLPKTTGKPEAIHPVQMPAPLSKQQIWFMILEDGPFKGAPKVYSCDF